MSKAQSQTLASSPEEAVASALNEQGFLFAQVVREKFRNQLPNDPDLQEGWRFLASEYPVTATDGSQTRIDHVLQHGFTHLVLECKRANPNYKKWVFFDKVEDAGRGPRILLETAQCSGRSADTVHAPSHSLTQIGAPRPCQIFNYYLETALQRQNHRWSATETIEEAFQQVVRGQSGLMAKALAFPETNISRVVPVVVTSAELFAAKFEASAISLTEGFLKPDDLTLSPLEFCGVNFHANDNLSVQSKWANDRPRDVAHDLDNFQCRTVFVVQSQALNYFLRWAKERLVEI